MVVYEVNLSINNAIYSDYYKWLLGHIAEILTITGFKHAEIGKIEQLENNATTQLRISYYIDSYEHFQRYLNKDAPRLRAEAIQKFGDHFSANRRVISDVSFLTTSSLQVLGP